jgi:hypothetical protein
MVIRSRRMRLEKHAEHTEEMRNTHSILVGKHQEKRSVARYIRGWRRIILK